MPAGLFLLGNIIRFSDNSDDSVGGAVPSGTIVYSNVFSRISSRKPTLALLEQGLETPNMYDAYLSPSNIQIQTNDELIITAPPASHYVGMTFRIVGTSKTSMDDPRRFVKVTLRYLEKANQIQ